MTYLYDVPICNFLGQPFQWLREISNMETEDAETIAWVHHAPPVLASEALVPLCVSPDAGAAEGVVPPLARPPQRDAVEVGGKTLTLIQTQVAEPDEDDCDSSWCLHRLHALRLAGLHGQLTQMNTNDSGDTQ